VAVAVLVFSMAAFGQQGTSTIVGTVVDSNDAVIANATVSLTSTDTTATRTVKTGAAGAFRLDGLVPGHYNIKATNQGFKTLEVNDINLISSESRDLGRLTLQVGAVTQSVSVTAEATPVQTSSSERASSVSTEQLTMETTKGRDPFGLLHLLPGIVDTNQDGRDTVGTGSFSGLSVNGNRNNTLNPVVDGAPTKHPGCDCSSYVVPSVDAIAELHVLTNGLQAEYGHDAGGTINFITKGGTSQFHGTFSWEHRNEGLAANSFFNNRNLTQKPIDRYTNLSGTIGGPIYIPHVVPQRFKNKLFFFFSPEWYSSKQSTSTSRVNEPTALERSGDFSQTFYGTGTLEVIKDPATGQNFAGNKIPATCSGGGSCITAIGQAMLNILPMPTGYVNPTSVYSANSSFSMTPGNHRTTYIARIDANVTSKLVAYFRMGDDVSWSETVHSPTAGMGRFWQFYPGNSRLVHLSWVISPTMVNEFQYNQGFINTADKDRTGQYPNSAFYRTATLNPPRFGGAISTSTETFWGRTLYVPYLPSMSFSGNDNRAGYTSFTTTGSQRPPYINGDKQITWRDDLTKVMGSHSPKAGIYWERMRDCDMLGTSYMGSFNFGSTPNNPYDAGNGYANALLGDFNTYSESSNRRIQDRHAFVIEFYLQDNWKVSRRLTVDYGVRFMHETGAYDVSHFAALFRPERWTSANAARLYWPQACTNGTTNCGNSQRAVDLVSGATAPPGFIGALVPGVGSAVNGVEYPVHTGITWPKLAWVPRVGFAYDLTGDKSSRKTVLRASAGLFHQRYNLNSLSSSTAQAPSVYTISSFSSFIPSITSAGGVLSPQSETAVRSNMPLETVYEVNVTVERELGFNTTASAAYVGNFDRHFGINQGLNNLPFGAYLNSNTIFKNAEIATNFLRQPYVGLGSVGRLENSHSNVNYHGLQTQVTHRFTKGLTFGGSYTFSKALGTTSWDAYHTGSPMKMPNGQTVTFPTQKNWYYGLSSTDRKHYGSLNFAWQLPNAHMPDGFAGAVADYIVNHWTLSGITSFSSGAAFSPSCSISGTGSSWWLADPTYTAAGGVRCNAVGDPNAFTQSFYTNFNVKAFAYPSAGTLTAPTPTFGNLGTGIFRQPSWWGQDVTIMKNLPLGKDERRSLQVNFQAYNVLNHTGFSSISSSMTFNTSGTITNVDSAGRPNAGQYSGTRNPRVCLLSVKLMF